MNELSIDDRELVRTVILDAADRLDLYGWHVGAANELHGPSCIWNAFFSAVLAYKEDGSSFPPALEFATEAMIIDAAEVNNLPELFRLNDSKSDEEGKAWAVEVLHKAATIAVAPSEAKATDTDLIPQTVSGNTTNVESLIKQLLRKWHLAK